MGYAPEYVTTKEWGPEDVPPKPNAVERCGGALIELARYAGDIGDEFLARVEDLRRDLAKRKT